MIKRIIVIGLLSFVFAFNSYAHESNNDRIDQLEKDVMELKLIMRELGVVFQELHKELKELNLQEQSLEEQPSDERSNSIANWRKLSRGMYPDDVRKILGEPHRVSGGYSTFWFYKNGGDVTFTEGRVSGWTEP